MERQEHVDAREWRMSRVFGTRAMAAVHAAIAAGLLLRPQAAARLLGADAGGGHPVLRLLGGRHLVEAAGLLLRPTHGVSTAAVAVDAAHAASCFGLAAVDGTHRRPALRDGLLASTLLLATALARPPRDIESTRS